jgi:dihydropteroate synthase
MGVLSVTPGLFPTADVRHAERSLAQARGVIAGGADIIDIGANPPGPMARNRSGRKNWNVCGRCWPKSFPSVSPYRLTA